MWLWLLPLVSSDRWQWQVTGAKWHAMHDLGNMTPERWLMTFIFSFSAFLSVSVRFGIYATIRTHREIQSLSYAGYFLSFYKCPSQNSSVCNDHNHRHQVISQQSTIKWSECLTLYMTEHTILDCLVPHLLALAYSHWLLLGWIFRILPPWYFIFFFWLFKIFYLMSIAGGNMQKVS